MERPPRASVAAILVATAPMLCGVRGAGVAGETDKDSVAAAETAAGEPEAVALLRIRKTDSQTEDDSIRYRQTQVELMTRPVVLAAALQRPDVAVLKCVEAEKDPVGWLARTVQVEAPRDSEIIRVRRQGVDAEEARTIVNAVGQAVLSEADVRERTNLLARRDALEREYLENMAEVCRRLATFNNLARALGTRDSEQAATQKTLLLDRLHSLREQTTWLEIDELGVETDIGVARKVGIKPDPKLGARLEVLKEQIANIAKESAGVFDELKNLGTASPDLEARKNEIVQLQAVTNQTAMELKASEVDLAIPSRVELIEKAGP